MPGAAPATGYWAPDDEPTVVTGYWGPADADADAAPATGYWLPVAAEPPAAPGLARFLDSRSDLTRTTKSIALSTANPPIDPPTMAPTGTGSFDHAFASSSKSEERGQQGRQEEQRSVVQRRSGVIRSQVGLRGVGWFYSFERNRACKERITHHVARGSKPCHCRGDMKQTYFLANFAPRAVGRVICTSSGPIRVLPRHDNDLNDLVRFRCVCTTTAKMGDRYRIFVAQGCQQGNIASISRRKIHAT